MKLSFPFDTMSKIYILLLLESELIHKTIHTSKIQHHILFFMSNKIIYCFLQAFLGSNRIPSAMIHSDAVLNLVSAYPHFIDMVINFIQVLLRLIKKQRFQHGIYT
ncbi:hypothetical protein D1872_236720 [compost metagenome]